MASRTMQLAVLLLAALVVAWAAGCAPTVKAQRAADLPDLEMTVQTIGLQPEGGMPAQVRVTVRNRATVAVSLTPPRPLVPGVAGPGGPADVPLPLLGVFIRDVAGQEETAVLTDTKSKVWPKPQTVTLAAGGEWSATYPLTGFYFWGPSGPDSGGPFVKYFWRGEKEVVLFSAALVFGEGRSLRSKPVAVRCAFEEWLFQKK